MLKNIKEASIFEHKHMRDTVKDCFCLYRIHNFNIDCLASGKLLDLQTGELIRSVFTLPQTGIMINSA